MEQAVNQTLETLFSHRSVRRFTDEKVERADLERAVAAGQAASTSSAVQAYCAIRVTRKAEREEIADLAGPQPMVARAPEFLVICGDTRRHSLICERGGVEFGQRLEGFVISVIDATLFAQNMVVALESMGYGICYVGGIRSDLPRLTRVLELPRGVFPLYGLCIGRPDQEPSARPRLPISSVLFDDRYPPDATVLEQVDAYDEAYRSYLEQRGVEGSSWSESMIRKMGHATRSGLAEYYRSQGADLS